MQPKIVEMNKRYIIGIFGNIESNQDEIWKKFLRLYKENPFTKVGKNDCFMYIWDNPNPEKTCFFGFESNCATDIDVFTTFEIPACEWAFFEVDPKKYWYHGDDENLKEKDIAKWQDGNGKYRVREYEGSKYGIEYYTEKFKGEEPNSILEVWYPLEKL